MCCKPRLHQNKISKKKKKSSVDPNLANIIPEKHAVISQNTAAITTIDRAEMTPTECGGRLQKVKVIP